MKAVLIDAFGPVDQARYDEVADPQPGPGEVLVDVEAIDVNYPDQLFFDGRYQVKPPFPFAPGFAAAGRVAVAGEGFAPGARVLAFPPHGAYASRLAVPAQACFPIPDDMPATVAAALGLAYQTAWFALTDRGGLVSGDAVLVLGTSGGVGMAALQLARALGAGKVIAATRGARGTEFARRNGADVVIDTAASDLRYRMPTEVRAATEGRGADLVIDPVGGAVTTAAQRSLAWRGRLVTLGFASGEIPSFNAGHLLVRNVAVTGLQWTDYRDREPGQVREAHDQICRLWSSGALKPVLSGTLPLSDFTKALDDLAKGRVQGKIVLLP